MSLGALAKNLHETNVTVSDRIVERLEKWLEPHNESKSSLDIKIFLPTKKKNLGSQTTQIRVKLISVKYKSFKLTSIPAKLADSVRLRRRGF